MPVDLEAYRSISNFLESKKVSLVAVSKTKPVSDIRELYNLGQRDFGENYVQELVDKQPQLPQDTRWHFIGHLQSNKVKYIASFVHLIHGVDSVSLMKEINKQALKHSRIIDLLLQVHIAEEETKFGLDAVELEELVQHYINNPFPNIRIRGLMGMASFSENVDKLRNEFHNLGQIMKKTKVQIESSNLPHQQVNILSMGMSGDYQIAIEEGSNMVRIGSLLFGARG